MDRAEMRRQAKKLAKQDKVFHLTRSQIEKMNEDAIVEFVERCKDLDGFYVLTQPQIDEMKKDAVKEAISTAYSYMIEIPTNVLSRCYWEKTAHKKIPKFIEECVSLYVSLGAGVVTLQDIIEDNEKVVGNKIDVFRRIKSREESK